MKFAKKSLLTMAVVALGAINAHAGLPEGAVSAMGSISIDDIATLITGVITFGVGLFAFRKVRSILKA